MKLQFEESVGPPATGKKWRRQSTEFHQVLVLTRGCDEAKQDQGVTVMMMNGIYVKIGVMRDGEKMIRSMI